MLAQYGGVNVFFPPMLLRHRQSGRGFLLSVFVCAFVLGAVVVESAGAQVPAASPSPARRHSLGLEAQSVATGGRSNIIGGTNSLLSENAVSTQSVGDRRVSSSRTDLQISVRNYAATPDSVRVEWYFVAQSVAASPDGRHDFIVHQDAQSLLVGGGKTATQTVGSPEVQAVYERSTTIMTAPAGYTFTGGNTSAVSLVNTQRGQAICGWMVRLVAEDGTVLAAKGSSQTYEDIAANPAKLAGMLARPGPPRPR